MGYLDDYEFRRSELERHRNNSARLAQAFAVYESTGQGSIEFGRKVDFGLTFVEQPRVSYGTVLDLDELADTLGVEPGETPPIPLITGVVTDWDQNARGFYLGAWVACTVRFMSTDLLPPTGTGIVDPTANVRLEHHFTFSGVAMKDVPVGTDD